MSMMYVFKPHLVKKIVYVTHKGKKNNYVQSLHTHHSNSLEMIYVDYGNITLTINEKIINLKAGNAIFISGGAKHAFSGVDGTPFDFLNIVFRGEIPKMMLDKVLPMSKACIDLMETLKEESIHDMAYKHEMVACKLTELVIQFFRQVSAALPNKPVEAAYRVRYKSEVINKAIDAIAQNYSSPLNLKQLSLSVCVSIPHLRALIKKETGESFTDILHKHRINAAKYLLRQDNLLIQDVASAVGYSSASFFFKIFKRITGMTPKEYALTLGDPSETN